MNTETNIHATKNFRSENIIMHPDETYVEVSTRSILKVRNCANKAKRKGMRYFCSCLYSVFWTYLGALLGYLPNIFEKSFSYDVFILYIIVTAIGLLSFFAWLILHSRVKDVDANLITTIEEELSEERVPTNWEPIGPNMYPSRNDEYKPTVKSGA